MTLRARLAISFAALATVVAVLMGALGYATVASRVTTQTDEALLNAAERVLNGPRAGDALAFSRDQFQGRRDPLPPQDRNLLITKVLADGSFDTLRGDPTLTPEPADVEIAASTEPTSSARTQEVAGNPYRVVVATNGNGAAAIAVARDWSEQTSVLRGLALTMVGLASALALLAALVGWWLARRITARLESLTAAAVQVSQTGSLDVEVPGEGNDEVGRLASAFNTMLLRLTQSQAEQQRLVQDAGHELRTPLTSIRTNISLLQRFSELDPEVQDRVVADLRGESAELTDLVNELLEIASGTSPIGEPAPVLLADVVDQVVERVRRKSDIELRVSCDDSVVTGYETLLERATWNLVENAIKFDSNGRAIEIQVRENELVVSDRGPGVSQDDQDQIFERFYRPVSSRSLPGSGLGLAIVKDVAETHRASVWCSERVGGGAEFHIKFPRSDEETGTGARS